MVKRLYSAVVDPVGAFPAQAVRLVASLTELAGVPRDQVVLHVVGDDPDPAVLASLGRLGVELVAVPAFEGHPWCNKLQQLEPLASREFDEVVLLDCDVLVLEEPPATRGAVAGKTVDFGRPSFDVLARVFALAELELRPTTADVDGAPTALGNVNGGVYVIDRSVFSELARAWRRWAGWCLEREEVFGDARMHIDQVAFALAVQAEGIPLAPLERRFNLPTHVQQPAHLDCEPALLHYHRALDEQQYLLPVADLPRVNAAIERVNGWLARRRREEFDNTVFWNARYALHPGLGSGVGSRGEVLELKRDLLTRAVDLLAATSVLDVGGGDGQTAAGLPSAVAVHAVDVAAAARAPYVEAVPRASWALHDIRVEPPGQQADLLVCLDVLIHEADPEAYRRAVAHLVAAGRPLLVSGFDAEPVELGPMTYFHEPLSRSLEGHGWLPVPVGAYRGLTAFLARPPAASDGRDLTEGTLRDALPLVEDPLVLLELVSRSRDVLGFFPDHLPRCIEYPWIAKHLPAGEGLRVLDAGAGVNALPFFLSDRGHTVFTADPHPVVRNGTAADTWNEWGFLDYAELDRPVTSFHLPYEQTDPDLDLDVVLSVSVIEHLPRVVRREWLRTAARQLRPGGRLLLTVDTVPFSTALWNHSEGRLVEDPDVHGDLAGLVADIGDAGFAVARVEHATWLPRTRVGMARVVATHAGGRA
ncbi:MAG: methyltransferase domain-containing protein [Nocardioides sp.]